MKKTIFVALLISAVMSAKADVTCTQYSNQTYCSDGTVYTQYGNMGFDNHGRTYTTYGNITYISGAEQQPEYTYRPNGHAYDQIPYRCWYGN